MSDLLAMNLKLFRKQKNISQAKLAEEAGISLMSVRRYETIGEDNREPQADTLKKIAEILDVEISELLSNGNEINIIEPSWDDAAEEVRQLTYSLNENGLKKTANYMYDLIATQKYKNNGGSN